jgi:tRNA (guanine26-N2/guanine27-N2)-dimethyltransferase
MGFSTVRCREGLVDFLVPKYAGVPSTSMPVFYNKKMELRRDVSVAVLKNILSGKSGLLPGSSRYIEILDGLSATGISGLRYAAEAGADTRDITVTLNDHNPVAFRLIARNIGLNSLENAAASRRSLNSILGERYFNAIDIDPFGSPVPYLDAAFQSLKFGGLLFLTATDVSVLFGTYPNACRRRYMADSARTPFSHELGLRILLGYCARTAAKYDIAIKPLLSYYADHYYRIFLATEEGSEVSDRCLDNIAYLKYDRKTCKRIIIRKKTFPGLPGTDTGIADGDCGLTLGPLWEGKMSERKFLENMIIEDYFGSKTRLEKMYNNWIQECDATPFFYTLAELSSAFGFPQPRLDALIKKLGENSYAATRTHFAPGAFRTDTPANILKSMLEDGI